MRALVCATLLAGSLLGCGGDSSGPNDVFPNADGVYNTSGSFDGLPTSDASFAGTLTLNQASQASGDITGSAAYLVTISGQVFNINGALTGAAISPTGIVTYSLTSGGTWTFTGTLAGTSLVNGRHSLSTSSGSVSGSWNATRATASAVVQGPSRAIAVDELAHRLVR
jgi:hypothetical protein